MTSQKLYDALTDKYNELLKFTVKNVKEDKKEELYEMMDRHCE